MDGRLGGSSRCEKGGCRCSNERSDNTDMYKLVSEKPYVPTILDGLKLLCEPGRVYELRCPKTKRGTLSGYFTDLELMAAAAEVHSSNVPAVYFTLNPVKPDSLALANNRVKDHAH